MIEARIAGALSILREKIPDSIKWAIAGSCNLALRGMDVRVHDIDIVTDKDGAYAIEKLFPPARTRKVELSASGKIRSHFGGIMLDDVSVDIIGDSQFQQLDGSWTPVRNMDTCRDTMDLNGKSLPLLHLEEEYEGYRNMGRLTQAAMILKYIKGTRS
jgi:hypothetical protein